MTKSFFVRTASGFVPADDADREAMRGIKIGSVVEVEVKQPRNLKLMRLYWKLCQTIAESVGAQAEAVSDVVKVRTGHVTVVKTASGLMEFPRSISFAQLDQQSFSKFFDEACFVVCAEFAPNLKPSALRDEILRMSGVPVESEAA
jgi:Protein of unknown function (DUF1367)